MAAIDALIVRNIY